MINTFFYIKNVSFII